MDRRPPHFNLAKERPEAFRSPNKMKFPPDLPSPRTGEVPPALSPLDAFAMQSRALARRFEEEAQNGRRISRLPPATVAEQMSNRPEYFRNHSGSSERRMSDVDEASEDLSPVSQRGKTFEPNPDRQRPMSQYPTIGNAEKLDLASSVPSPLVEEPEESPATPDAEVYFGAGAPRAFSPEPVDSRVINVEAPSPMIPGWTSSHDNANSPHPRSLTSDSHRSQRSQASDRGLGLALPQSPHHPRSPRSFQSIRSVPPDSGDEDAQSMSGSHAVSSARKFSGSSGMSRPQSPFSPWMRPVHRSPSMTSEYSISGSQQLQRPSPNFSRPISSAGSRPSVDARPSIDTTPSSGSRPSLETRPSGELPHREPSTASSNTQTSSFYSMAPSRQTSGDGHRHVPASLDLTRAHDYHNHEHFYGGEKPPGSASYIYAKYALPRGRTVDRDSADERESWIQHQFDWDNAPPQRPTDERKYSTDAVMQSIPRPASPAVSERGRIGRESNVSSSTIRSRSANPRAIERGAASHRYTPSVKTESTDRTIRPTSLHQKSSSADLTPDEHLEIGIQAHNKGETNKSTYHLRLAAMAGLPTAMLLYGLACRHGWGMRPNQEEGVKWLRKAVATSGLDSMDGDDKVLTAVAAPPNPAIATATAHHDAADDPIERKKRKAQYALAIYELGISAMNGWGCAKDKPLALRCYEIAGRWGDADALAEAGFCYTQGVGCKKDFKKAAALYRQAAANGMSMAGNSWYVFLYSINFGLNENMVTN